MKEKQEENCTSHRLNNLQCDQQSSSGWESNHFGTDSDTSVCVKNTLSIITS
jgi:hypothetical protein